MAALIQSYCHPPRSPVPRTVHSPPTVIGPQYQPRPWSLEQLFVCQFQGKGGGSRVFSVRSLLITLRLVHRLCMFVAYGVVLGNCTPGTIPSRNAKPTFCTGQAVPALAPLSSALKPDCRTRDGVMKKKVYRPPSSFKLPSLGQNSRKKPERSKHWIFIHKTLNPDLKFELSRFPEERK